MTEKQQCRTSVEDIIRNNIVETKLSDGGYSYTICGIFTYVVPSLDVKLQTYLLLFILSQHVLGKKPERIQQRVNTFATAAKTKGSTFDWEGVKGKWDRLSKKTGDEPNTRMPHG